jgi:hypothetical protein
MEAIVIQKEQFEQLLTRVDEIRSAVLSKGKKPEDSLLGNQEFIKLMNISKRTAQAWRDEGQISFSQLGGKIYYRMSDVQKLLDGNYRQAFKPGRRNSNPKFDAS